MGRKPTYEELELRVKALEKEVADTKRMGEPLQEVRDINQLLNFAPYGLYLIDLSGKILLCNRKGANRIGKTVETAMGTFLLEHFPSEVSENRKLKGMESARLEQPITFEDRIDDRWYRNTISPILAENGRPVRFAIYGVDITEQKTALEALKKSEERLKIAGKASYDMIYEWVIADDTLEWFGDVDEMLGYKPNEVPKTIEGWVRLIHPEDVTKLGDAIKHHRTSTKPIDYEYRVKRKDGLWTYWTDRGLPILGDNGRPAKWIGACKDITIQKQAEMENQKLQTQFQKAQKMEAIGTLAGGIAHDFNNLLTAIQGRASIMRMNKDASHPDFEYLKGIESCVGSAADLTRQLLGFARGGKFEVKPTDLNKLIKNENRMFSRTKKEIAIHEKFEENLWTVEIDRGQIQQVLLNLYVNAGHAMPGGGNLYLKTENVNLDKSYVKPFAIEHGRYVKISVTDTGIGMDKTIQTKIFDPFFTTKEMGRGTGLGLSSAYGIIKNHGGFLNVYSEKSHGSTFNIYLPASKKEVIEEKKSSWETSRGFETVLFVDDEKIITEVAEDLLKLLGYKVLIAGGGKEAVRIYEEKKTLIDMVILDMIMPVMSGGDTFDRMKNLNPQVKVLLSSGYSINGQATEILDRGCKGFIQKPFKTKELSKKLREILDEK